MYSVKISNFLKERSYLLYFLALIVFFLLYSLAINQIKLYSHSKEKKFNSFLKSDELTNITDYIFKNLNSPYKEFVYIVQINDTIEKILKKHNVINLDINSIALAVNAKKLSNVFAKTEVKIVIKEELGENKIVSLSYPTNEITTVEIKRNKDKFLVNENILKLEKKKLFYLTQLKTTCIALLSRLALNQIL